MALDRRLRRTCFAAQPVDHHQRQRRAGSRACRRSCSLGAAAHQARAFRTSSSISCGFLMQLHLARLRLGQIENVVDQRQKMLAGAVDVSGIIAIARIAGTEHLLADDVRRIR